MLRLVGLMISLRSRISKVGTGDQAIFVRREIFAELGGFPDIPLMEDVAFSRALKRRGEVACLAQPRRYFRAALEAGRDLEHDIEDVDAQVALSRRHLAGAFETVLWRYALMLLQ